MTDYVISAYMAVADVYTKKQTAGVKVTN